MSKINTMIKCLLCTCLICLVLGGGVAIAGVALGGTFGEAGIFIGERNLLHPWLFAGPSKEKSTDGSQENPPGDGAYSTVAADIRDLDIEIHNCELIVGESEDEQIYVSVEEKGRKYCKIDADGDTLKIKDTRSSKHMSKLKSFQIYLDIPTSHSFSDVDLDLGAGTIEIKTLNANDMEISGGAGTFHADRLTVKDTLEAELGVGDFSIAKAQLGDTQIKCGVGSMEIESCELNGDAKIKGGVGDVTIGLDANESDYNYKLDCGVGDLDVFGENYHALGREKEIDHDAPYTITLKCGVGSMCVKKAADK